jgi:hypothetical protein
VYTVPRIFSTTEAGNLYGIKGLVYGRAGIGKTSLAATAPAPFVISAEKGLLSLKRFNIPAVDVRNISDLKNIASWMEQSYEARQHATFFLDSITEIAEQVLEYEKERQGKNKFGAYGELAEQLTKEFRRFRDIAGPNVIFTAKEKREKNGMEWFSRPLIPGQVLPDAMPYFFDELFHYTIVKFDGVNETRAFRCQPSIDAEAKDRSGMLNLYEPPHLSYVFNKILGEQRYAV